MHVFSSSSTGQQSETVAQHGTDDRQGLQIFFRLLFGQAVRQRRHDVCAIQASTYINHVYVIRGI